MAIGDLVWGKMKGYPLWPGKIAVPEEDVKPSKVLTTQVFVRFFGTGDYAWLSTNSITPHSEEMLEKAKALKKKPTNLVLGIEQMIQEAATSLPSTSGKCSPLLPKEEKPAKRSAKKKPPLSSILPRPKRKTATLGKPASEVLTANYPSLVSHPKRQKTSRGKKRGRRPFVRQELTTEFIDPEDVSKQEPRPFIDPPKRATEFVPYEGLAPPTSGSSHNGTSPKVTVISKSSTPSQDVPPAIFHPPYSRPPDTPPVYLGEPSDYLQQKEIIPCPLTIGFLGLGMMGRGMVKNLVQSGHRLVLWNRTRSKCTPFVECGATAMANPRDVIAACDVTFSCVADRVVARKVVFGDGGVLEAMRNGKGYVEMTAIDPEFSKELEKAVNARGGSYLEAPVMGSQVDADEGKLIVLGAGDKELYDTCSSCFRAMSKESFFFGPVGHGATVNLNLSALTGAVFASMGETVALSKALKISPDIFLLALESCGFATPNQDLLSRAMLNNDYTVKTSLKHQKNRMILAKEIAEHSGKVIPVVAAATEVYIRANKRCNSQMFKSKTDHDVSAVHLASLY